MTVDRLLPTLPTTTSMPSPKRKWPYVLLVLSVASVVGVAAWFSTRTGPHAHEDVSPQEALAIARETEGKTATWRNGPISHTEIGREVESAAAKADVAGLDSDDLSRISEQSARLFSLLREGTIDDYELWRRATNLPPSVWVPEGDADGWDRLRSPLAGAALDLDSVQVVVRASDGRSLRVPEPPRGRQVSQTKRDVKAEHRDHPGRVDLSTHNGPIVEVVMPLVWTDAGGTRVPVHVGIGFAERESDGQWVPVSATLIGIPNGMSLPPIPI